MLCQMCKHCNTGSPPLSSIYVEWNIIKQLPSEARRNEMAFAHWKPLQFRFTSPSIHLGRVGYYKIIAERSEAQGDGIYTLETTAI